MRNPRLANSSVLDREQKRESYWNLFISAIRVSTGKYQMIAGCDLLTEVTRTDLLDPWPFRQHIGGESLEEGQALNLSA
jgi:hypothetical protein